MSKRYKKMLTDHEITQKDIDDAAEMKVLIEDAFVNVYPSVSFEMLLLWWLIVEPGVA
jgi:hypothetical protein